MFKKETAMRQGVTPALAAAMMAAAALLATLVLMVSTARAEDSVTLGEAIAGALANNDALKAKRLGTESLRNEKNVAMSRLLPRLSLEERYTKTNNPTYAFMGKLNQGRFEASDFDVAALNDPDLVSGYQTALGLEMAVFNKKAYVGLDMAKTAVRASESEFERLREEVAFLVIEAYAHINASKGYAEAARKGLENATEHLRIAELRETSGLGMHADTLRASVAMSEAEKAVAGAEKNLKISKLMLGLLMGKGEPVDATETYTEPSAPDGVESYIEAAKERNDIAAVGAMVENAKNMVSLAEADYYPTVGLGGTYQWDDQSTPFGSDGTSWTVAAFIRINLFDGMERKNARLAARNRAKEAGQQLEGMKKKVAFEVYEAYYALEEAAKRHALSVVAEKAAEEGARLMRKRYENSLAPLVALLDAQSALDAARAGAAESLGAYYVASARLEFVSGRPVGPEQVLNEGGDTK